MNELSFLPPTAFTPLLMWISFSCFLPILLLLLRAGSTNTAAVPYAVEVVGASHALEFAFYARKNLTSQTRLGLLPLHTYVSSYTCVLTLAEILTLTGRHFS